MAFFCGEAGPDFWRVRIFLHASSPVVCAVHSVSFQLPFLRQFWQQNTVCGFHSERPRKRNGDSAHIFELHSPLIFFTLNGMENKLMYLNESKE
ncbi:MAG: hypothetical protein A2283_14210 [Lentisphaerae bacterium RIFOXYA12_FULL_48_11]|nr:MAG: hypothetical protein A2283_14210 [Lentisphaerae bacterium RIFOXYA12_FULL_48_11]